MIPSRLLLACSCLATLAAADHEAHGPAVPATAPPAAAHAPSPSVSPVEAMLRLSAGNARFAFGRRSRSAEPEGDGARRAELLAGQHPFAALVSCADSRVAPELLFDQGLGDLFVVRNAGNVADPVALGSLEYAVEHLGVAVVVVLGHSRCGAVTAVSGAGAPLPGNLVAIQERMPGLHDHAESRRRAGDEPAHVLASAVERNASAQAEALLAGSPVLRAAASNGLLVVPAVYDLEGGLVTFLPAAKAGRGPAPAPAHGH